MTDVIFIEAKVFLLSVLPFKIYYRLWQLVTLLCRSGAFSLLGVAFLWRWDSAPGEVRDNSLPGMAAAGGAIVFGTVFHLGHRMVALGPHQKPKKVRKF